MKKWQITKEKEQEMMKEEIRERKKDKKQIEKKLTATRKMRGRERPRGKNKGPSEGVHPGPQRGIGKRKPETREHSFKRGGAKKDIGPEANYKNTNRREGNSPTRLRYDQEQLPKRKEP